MNSIYAIIKVMEEQGYDGIKIISFTSCITHKRSSTVNLSSSYFFRPPQIGSHVGSSLLAPVVF